MSTAPLTLILDAKLLVGRLVELARADDLTPERLVAITDRVTSHLNELREELVEPEIAPLPVVAMRFHRHLGVIDGGLQS